MQLNISSRADRRGITVLTLLLIIIAVILVAFFLVSYLRTRPAQIQSSSDVPAAVMASAA